jgi:hypothetical protein
MHGSRRKNIEGINIIAPGQTYGYPTHNLLERLADSSATIRTLRAPSPQYTRRVLESRNKFFQGYVDVGVDHSSLLEGGRFVGKVKEEFFNRLMNLNKSTRT